MIALILLAQAAVAEPLSDQVRKMVEAAYKSGNQATIDAVVGVAKATFPDDALEIDRIAAGNAAVLAQTRKEEQEREAARIAAARFYEIWQGEIEGGATRSTGSTDTLGLYAAAALNRDGLRWQQKVTARFDLQQTDKRTTTERWVAAWQPNYKFGEHLYSYGLGQYEHDRFLGYTGRGTLGIGIGYTAVSRPDLKVSVDVGPALRRTVYVDTPTKTSFAGRASLTARWSISPTLTFGQDAAVFVEDTTNANATTTLDTKLLGNLKARFSYNVRYESAPTDGKNTLDTITRATLVYGF